MAKFQKIHDSIHYNEIVKLLLEGKSSRYISDYLKTEYEENITHATINNFKKEELDIKNKVNKKFQKKVEEQVKAKAENKIRNDVQVEADIETAVNKGVGTRELLQLMIESGPQIWKQVLTDKSIGSEEKMKLILQASRQELDWIKEDSVNVEVDLDANLSNLGEMIRKGVEDYKDKE